MINTDILIQEETYLRGKRSNIENLWQCLSDLCLEIPDDITRQSEGGEDKTWYRYDDTAIFANHDRAAHLVSILANPETDWIDLEIEGKEEEDNNDFIIWLEDNSKIFRKKLKNPITNFYSELHKGLLDDGVYGIFAMLVQKKKDYLTSEVPFYFKTYNIKDFVFCRDDEGIVDRFFLQFKLTLGKAVEKFGINNLSSELRSLYADGKAYFKEIDFYHIIVPREERDYTKKNKFNRKFAGYFIEKKSKHIIDEQGYNYMPYVIFSGLERSKEIYPSSPAMSAIGTIRQLNHHEWLDDVAREKNVDPSFGVFDDAVLGGEMLDLSAGGVNVLNSKSRGQGNPIFPIQSEINLNSNAEKTMYKRNQVLEAFMVMQFETMAKANMTATEAVLNSNQQMRKASPVIMRLFSSLGLVLERALDIIIEIDNEKARAFGVNLNPKDLIFPPIPDSVEDIKQSDIKFRFKSPLAKSLRQEEFEGLQLHAQMFAQLGQFDPNIIDKYNVDEVADEITDILGVSHKTIRGDDEVEAIRQLRAQTQQAQMQMQSMQQVADVAKTAGEASQLFQGGQ